MVARSRAAGGSWETLVGADGAEVGIWEDVCIGSAGADGAGGADAASCGGFWGICGRPMVDDALEATRVNEIVGGLVFVSGLAQRYRSYCEPVPSNVCCYCPRRSLVC